MVADNPHYLLFCESNASEAGYSSGATRGGRWHFVLEKLGGGSALEATDYENAATSDRLALLSVVRGLEALEQPSNVTLITTSRYVNRGLRFGLNTWRDSEYQWERFGVRMPVRNADLWRRVDTALHFHGVTCRLIRSQQALGARNLNLDISNSDSASVATLATEKDVADSVAAATQPVVAVTLPIAPAGRMPQAAMNETRFSAAAPFFFQEFWWKLAQQWMKWWRGRFQFKPAFYGT